MSIEIERKFILPRNFMEDKPYTRSREISQGYLNEGPRSVIRVRLCRTSGGSRTTSGGYLTIKTNRGEGLPGLNEYEYLIPYFHAVELFNSCSSTISKVRYDIILGQEGHILEVDVFKGRHEGLVVGEVEFKSEEDFTNFKTPVFAIKEVTDDKRFSNFYLSNALQENVDNIIREVYNG